MSLYYKKGYKYQVTRDLKPVHIQELFGVAYRGDFIALIDGYLYIYKGYAWDGPSGPAIDTDNFMRGSCVHDALYQFMRMEIVAQSFRPRADKLMQEICKEAGMGRFRRWYTLRAVRRFAARAADPKNRKKEFKAP